MKALTWHGKGDIRCENVPDPKIEHPRDAIIKVTACAICGSDLHIYDGIIPDMKKGDVLGHETMGEVVEVGAENKKLKVGDRVVVPFTISCGECFFCRNGLFFGLRTHQSRPREGRETLGPFPRRPVWLFPPARRLCRRPGGISARVPYADVGPIKVPGNGSATNKFCSCRTSSRPATWPPTSATSSAATQLRFGAADRSASSRFAAPSCSARNASSPSIPCRNGLILRAQAGAETIDFMKEDVYDRIHGTDRRPRRRCLHRCGRHRSRADGQCGLRCSTG